MAIPHCAISVTFTGPVWDPHILLVPPALPLSWFYDTAERTHYRSGYAPAPQLPIVVVSATRMAGIARMATATPSPNDGATRSNERCTHQRGTTDYAPSLINRPCRLPCPNGTAAATVTAFTAVGPRHRGGAFGSLPAGYVPRLPTLILRHAAYTRYAHARAILTPSLFSPTCGDVKVMASPGYLYVLPNDVYPPVATYWLHNCDSGG